MNLPKSATRIPKQFMSLLIGCCSGRLVPLFSTALLASCGRFRATAMPMGTELPVDYQEG